ncbi:unnamed protein product [Chondrus crispus]|uniref:Uncharacterized protein n=1 Tax=Chondrus crispus TaxID=2769 RepID=R7QBC4_CHOCR|nr:unnamed protein product [Chondrus crispus]CDF34721.1 unnamed protein product [Chondrus crispus]|eukprot:XP_005714540.1 unnamed protein product [Chondrus crispus]
MRHRGKKPWSRFGVCCYCAWSLVMLFFGRASRGLPALWGRARLGLHKHKRRAGRGPLLGLVGHRKTFGGASKVWHIDQVRFSETAIVF